MQPIFQVNGAREYPAVPCKKCSETTKYIFTKDCGLSDEQVKDCLENYICLDCSKEKDEDDE